MASFTSVSLMSTSSWDNGSGCPIISPSRWNPIVASNLSVIENHDHAASAGESSQSFAAHYFHAIHTQYIEPWFPVSNDGWVIEQNANWPGGGCLSTSTLGAALEYDIYLPTGNISHEFVMYHGTGSAMCFVAACVNGSPIGDVDFLVGTTIFSGYVGPTEVPGGGDFSLTTIVAASTQFTPPASGGCGMHKLRIQTVYKQDNSSGYIARIGYMKVRRITI